MIVVPRELVEGTLIKSIERRTVQVIQDWRDVLVDKGDDGCEIRNESLEDRRNSLLGGLEEEASEVVAFEESLRIIDAAGDIARVHADERVGCACVSAELDHIRVFGRKNCHIGLMPYQKNVAERISRISDELTNAGTTP